MQAFLGMMNPAFSKIGAESVSLTFVTGNLSRIGGHLASAAGPNPLQDAQGPKEQSRDFQERTGFQIGSVHGTEKKRAWSLVKSLFATLQLVQELPLASRSQAHRSTHAAAQISHDVEKTFTTQGRSRTLRGTLALSPGFFRAQGDDRLPFWSVEHF